MENETIIEVRDGEQKLQNDYFLPLSILVSGILIAGSIVYLATGGFSQGGPLGGRIGGDAAKTAPVAGAASVEKLRERDVVLGDPKAPVTLIEYGDYQCPFCVRFNQTTEPLVRQNEVKNGTVRMVFRAFSFLGAESQAAAAAAECAKDQGKFWVFHDALYRAEAADEQKNPTGAENNGNLNRDLFMQLANEVGLNAASFASCVDSGKYADQVQKDSEDAQALGVNSTPTLYLNGQKVLGAVPYEGAATGGTAPLKTIIQQLLKK